jgi:hypothetical protein
LPRGMERESVTKHEETIEVAGCKYTSGGSINELNDALNSTVSSEHPVGGHPPAIRVGINKRQKVTVTLIPVERLCNMNWSFTLLTD